MLPKNSAKSSDALLDKLPPLVLDQICRYLAKYDGRSRRSLRSFSLANSRCYSAATSQLFRQLYLTLDAVRGIAGAIEASNATLGNDRLWFVHDLTICDSGNENRSGWPYELEQEEANYGDDGKGGPFHRILAATRYFYGLPEGRKETTDEKNDRIQRWLPLANYLERLPSLASITWTHSDQVPSCIVEALKQRPRIKLIIETFSLRGAYQQGGRGQNMDPEECALITSPCLHTIVVPHFSYDDFGCWDYNGDAVKEIASSATPDGWSNLRHVVMINRRPGDGTAVQSLETRLPWQGFRPPVNAQSSSPSAPLIDASSHAHSAGCLQSLCLLGDPDWMVPSLSSLLSWKRCIDFSVLARLELQPAGYDTLKTLTDMARCGQFDSLESLYLGTWWDDREMEPDKVQNMDHMAVQLLKALPPLRNLKMEECSSDGLFQAIMDRHGSTLRILHIFPGNEGTRFLGLEQVNQIVRVCRLLQGLTLLIPRSLGNAFETAIYRALGRLPVLEYIKLILDCTILDKTRFRLRLSESSGLLKPEESSEQEATFLRETLFNVAVDSTLAKSIFRTIAQSQSMETGIPYEALPLYRVVLEVLPDYHLYGEISNVRRWIGRNWVCERRSISEGDDGNGTLSFGVATKELNRLARLDAGSLLDDEPWWFQDSAFFKSVWNSLWPTGSSGDQGDWKNAWRSFPLSDL
ncbi:hypothetical protein S40288_11650 [Stachybotrys chartarum IBT 40288]|nr:hypothetical protein S40288_11650 [Stachybotrys chartarum IBT 40288]